MQKPIFSRVLALVMVVAVCCLCSVAICGTSIQGSSFNTLEFDKSYVFALPLDSCLGLEGTSIGSSDGGLSASAASDGFENVGFSVTTEKDFDPSVMGKSGAVLELSLNIPDINGFLDSTGNFIGGLVTLSVAGIEYQWSLDDVNVTKGENVIRLNIRTATTLYPQSDMEDTSYSDEEEDGDNLSEVCVLGVYLRKLPSKEKASFILKEAAIEIPRVALQDKNDTPLPSDDIGKTEIIIAFVIGAAIIITIVVWTIVVVKKEEAKKRKKRRRKRVQAQE